MNSGRLVNWPTGLLARARWCARSEADCSGQSASRSVARARVLFWPTRQLASMPVGRGAPHMFSHYLSTALRHFQRQKLTTAINVVSLAIGLGAFLGLFSVVAYLGASDSQWPGAARIYAITQKTLDVRSRNQMPTFRPPLSNRKVLASRHARARAGRARTPRRRTCRCQRV